MTLTNKCDNIFVDFDHRYKVGQPCFVPMEFPMKCNTVKSGRSIVYIEGSQVIIKKKTLHFFPCGSSLSKQTV